MTAQKEKNDKISKRKGNRNSERAVSNPVNLMRCKYLHVLKQREGDSPVD